MPAMSSMEVGDIPSINGFFYPKKLVSPFLIDSRELGLGWRRKAGAVEDALDGFKFRVS